VRGWFVTATDTGVGKTAVTGALAVALRERGIDVGVAKPVQSGALADDPTGDAMQLLAAAGVTDSPAEICPYAFPAPLAPLVAARLEAVRVQPDVILSGLETLASRHGLLLVEGAGGLLVPVGEGWTIADLAAWIGLPLVVVARPGLGTVNHTLLTIASARERGLDIACVILNGIDESTDESWQTNPELISSFGEVKTVTLPWVTTPPGELARALSAHLSADWLLGASDPRPSTRPGRVVHRTSSLANPASQNARRVR
jgi:dethiobiotin synthetase